MSTPRIAELSRETSESSIALRLDLDGTGRSSISTTVPFFDHMLTAFAKHALVDLEAATPRTDIGECLVDGVGFLAAGVSYRSADGTSTWVQHVQEYGGDIGVVTRDAFSTVCEWRPCQIERTPALGEP